jgi:hypothetical protein
MLCGQVELFILYIDTGDTAANFYRGREKSLKSLDIALCAKKSFK